MQCGNEDFPTIVMTNYFHGATQFAKDNLSQEVLPWQWKQIERTWREPPWHSVTQLTFRFESGVAHAARP